MEDDAANREALRLVVEMGGHRVATASTGEEALELAAAERPDTVLLDMRLPDQGGQAVSTALRARISPAPRIIITSGMSLDSSDAAQLGADVILQKPFAPDRLLELLSPPEGT